MVDEVEGVRWGRGWWALMGAWSVGVGNVSGWCSMGWVVEMGFLFGFLKMV